MPRIMRDSTTPTDIPTDGTQLVAGYANGAYAWDQGGWDRFAHIPRATIDVTGAQWWRDVLDVESGDAPVHAAVAWARRKWQGVIIYPPVIYCSRDTIPVLEAAMSAADFALGHHYRLWVATLDGTQTLPDMTGVIAVQYGGEAITGGHYDVSIVYDDAWEPGITPSAPPPPVQQPREGVLVELPDGATKALSSTDGGVTWK